MQLWGTQKHMPLNISVRFVSESNTFNQESNSLSSIWHMAFQDSHHNSFRLLLMSRKKVPEASRVALMGCTLMTSASPAATCMSSFTHCCEPQIQAMRVQGGKHAAFLARGMLGMRRFAQKADKHGNIHNWAGWQATSASNALTGLGVSIPQ